MGGTIEIVSVPDRYAYPARSLMMFYGPADHQMFDLHKVKAELGYRDPIDPAEALRRTVRWYRDNPPDVPAQFATDLAENYRMEDDIVPIYRDACARWDAINHVARDYHHSYPHPKKPGLAKDHRAR
jgi:hypothetical protein